MEEMINAKRDVMKPVLMKMGVACALTFAGFLYSHLRNRRIRPDLPPPLSPGAGRTAVKDEARVVPSSPVPAEKEETLQTAQKAIENPVIGFSPSSRNSADAEGFLLPEFNELIQKEIDVTGFSPTVKEMEIAGTKRADEGARVMEQEIENLRNVVRVLRERERNLEIQLLEYYGLKEQQAAMRELQNRLKINTMESQLFTLKVESLQADNRRLEAQVAEHSRLVNELDSARAKIKQLKRKMRSDSEQAKEQLSALHQRVSALKEQELMVAMNDADIQKKVQRIKDLEDELAELRGENSILEHENSELVMKLESTQKLISSVPEAPKAEVLEEVNRLRQTNDEFEREIERLRADRCADVEELVYLRWVNACLRYELRNYQPPPGKTVARDLSKSLSPKSEAKAKQLILEYANSGIDESYNTQSLIDFDLEYCSSSQSSTIVDAGDVDDTSPYASSSGKAKFFGKLKRMVLGKDIHSNRSSSGDKTPKNGSTSERRPSVSMASVDNMLRTCSTDSASSCTTIENAATNLSASGIHPFHDSNISRELQWKSEEQRSKINQSQGNARLSLDTQRLRNLSLDELQWKSEEQGSKINQSQGNARFSLDTQRLRNLSLEELQDINLYGERISDVWSSSSGSKRMVLGERGMMEYTHHEDRQQDHDHDTPEKMELVKFAQALKSSRGHQKVQRRSASFAYY